MNPLMIVLFVCLVHTCWYPWKETNMYYEFSDCFLVYMSVCEVADLEVIIGHNNLIDDQTVSKI